MVIFMWKIAQGLVKGYEAQFTSVYGRRGRIAIPNVIVSSAPALVRKARLSSIGVKGAKIFNLLPADIRNSDVVNVDSFKKMLDEFLSQIPDQPTTPGMGRAAESNSLLHQIPMFLLSK